MLLSHHYKVVSQRSFVFVCAHTYVCARVYVYLSIFLFFICSKTNIASYLYLHLYSISVYC
jgi:hypothetical protein